MVKKGEEDEEERGEFLKRAHEEQTKRSHRWSFGKVLQVGLCSVISAAAFISDIMKSVSR